MKKKFSKSSELDDISIRMIKICDKSLVKPLILLFQNSAKLSYFPDIWKRSNIIPVHKKSDKELIENYQPISLLPIFGKIFEKIIFGKIYHFMLEERLLIDQALSAGLNHLEWGKFFLGFFCSFMYQVYGTKR